MHALRALEAGKPVAVARVDHIDVVPARDEKTVPGPIERQEIPTS